MEGWVWCLVGHGSRNAGGWDTHKLSELKGLLDFPSTHSPTPSQPNRYNPYRPEARCTVGRELVGKEVPTWLREEAKARCWFKNLFYTKATYSFGSPQITICSIYRLYFMGFRILLCNSSVKYLSIVIPILYVRCWGWQMVAFLNVFVAEVRLKLDT